MQKLLGIAAASAVALFALSASADEVTGEVSNIDQTTGTFEVEGMVFTASPQNTVGVDLSELKEGDTVSVTYTEQAEHSGETVINAMTLEKVEQ
jgi:hypothetical protein